MILPARILTVLLLISSALVRGGALPIRIGVPAGESGIETIRRWSELNRRLNDRGVDAAFEVLEDNAAVVESLKSRFIDVGFLDPFWFHRFRGSLAPLAEAAAPGRGGSSVLVIVPRNSIVYRVEGLAGVPFALSSNRETACGYFVPLALLSRYGLRLRDPGSVVFAETGLSVLKSVAYGGVGAGSLSSALLEDERHARLAEEVRVIAESEPLPPPVLAVRKDDGEGRYDPLRDELVSMASSPAGLEALSAAGFSGFVRPALKEYAALERYLREYEAAYGAQD